MLSIWRKLFGDVSGVALMATSASDGAMLKYTCALERRVAVGCLSLKPTRAKTSGIGLRTARVRDCTMPKNACAL